MSVQLWKVGKSTAVTNAQQTQNTMPQKDKVMQQTHTFHENSADVAVTPIGNFVEDRMPHPFKVQVIPNIVLLPVETFQVNEPYYFSAAEVALDLYKEKYGLNPTSVWSFAD